MDFATFLWTTLAAFLTLSTFSFLYKDNPFYRFAEHLVVGVSAGYFVIILWHNGLVPNLFQRLADGDWYLLWLNSSRAEYLIPTILGLMMFTRFSSKLAWVSRWPMAVYIGIATGIAIPLEMKNRVIRQFGAMMTDIEWGNFFGQGFLDTAAGYSEVVMLIGTLAALIYFFFSKPHTGVLGGTARVGIWVLMIGFGASFGYTVMARISLFVQRIQYLDQQWIQNAFNTGNPNYHAGFQVVFWLVVLVVLGYTVLEIVRHLGRRSAPSDTA